MPLYSQEEHDADVEYFEIEIHKIRQKVATRKMDGLVAKRMFDILDRLVVEADQKLKTGKFIIASSKMDAKAAKESGHPRDQYSKVSAEDAVFLKQKGFNTRFDGVKWEVRTK